MKKHFTEWEKIFETQVPNPEYIYILKKKRKKNLYKSTIKRQKNLVEKGAKNLDKNFCKEDIKWPTRTTGKCNSQPQ